MKNKKNDLPERDKMSYFDHIKKLFKRGKVTKKQLKKSKSIKSRAKSKYDL